MLKRTFLHFPNVGERREKLLWKYGYLDWEDIINLPPPSGWSRFWLEWQKEAERSLVALDQKNSEYFALSLPTSHWWRAIPEFLNEAVYLDIETDEKMDVTVIGLADRTTYYAFLEDEEIDKVYEIIFNAKMLVTYNGKNFDVPILKKKFKDLKFPILHIDLCPLFRRLGYKGGLKAIETQLGIERSHQTQGLNGWDAVKLWQKWKYFKDKQAFETLLMYNYEDVVHLKSLLKIAYEKLWKATIELV
ncbi:ribonuclease H-like domain-containing protein [Pseudothermotoga thermarum]|uniref:YprB ribonuclease H-like domain-containing protein n=1 Tax=Pseudothermotoga thermarum DSM 5069 TaxID=688269 RepID=F7YYQ6_9THEM|nr:ribonuclease H-like domain-containing protein [Pseudothermotoga thermarum]AEH51091.1 hypothetical protein Theth_1010 [Pseudothermotoga thermarum DSM 5069]